MREPNPLSLDLTVGGVFLSSLFLCLFLCLLLCCGIFHIAEELDGIHVGQLGLQRRLGAERAQQAARVDQQLCVLHRRRGQDVQGSLASTKLKDGNSKSL